MVAADLAFEHLVVEREVDAYRVAVLDQLANARRRLCVEDRMEPDEQRDASLGGQELTSRSERGRGEPVWRG